RCSVLRELCKLVPGSILANAGEVAERSRYARHDAADMTIRRQVGQRIKQCGQAGAHEQALDALLLVVGAETCRGVALRGAPLREMPRIGLRLGGPPALELVVELIVLAAQGEVAPIGAAGYDRELRSRELAAQTFPDMPYDDRNVTDQVAELVDPVEEHHDA